MKKKIIAVLTALGCMLAMLPAAVLAEDSLPGDCDQDGALTLADAALMQQYLTGQAEFTEAQFHAADFNHDGTADIFDLARIKYALTAIPYDPDAYVPREWAMIEAVPEFSQHPDYPTGCESAALYILLHSYGINITMERIVAMLPKGPAPYEGADGNLWGANPEKQFVGDPADSASYGVFNGPIAQTAGYIKPNPICRTGATMDDVLRLIDRDIPVEAWFIIDPDLTFIYRRQWYDYQTGELIRWPGREHAIVVCGYDAEHVIYRDPNTGGTRTVSKSIFAARFADLGGRIVYYDEPVR